MKQLLASQIVPGMERVLQQKDNGAEPTITGTVCMHQPGPNGKVMKIRLLGKAYESNFGHYMVFYQDKTYSKACAFINLKNCSVQPSDSVTLKIISQDCEGTSLTMSLSSEQEAQRWTDALKPRENFKTLPNGSKSPVIPRTPVLPTLEESEEE